MVYIQRDSGGVLIGVFANSQPGLAEELAAEDDPIVVAFLNRLTAPAAISDRQFFQQLALQGIITQEEALAAVKAGAIPMALQRLINGLPADRQFAATMIITGATTFERNHPLTIAIGAAYGWTSDQMDALFSAAAAL